MEEIGKLGKLSYNLQQNYFEICVILALSCHEINKQATLLFAKIVGFGYTSSDIYML